MNLLGELWRRLIFLFQRRRMEQDLAEEMRLHLDLRAEENTGSGVPSEDAMAKAQQRFGNQTLLQESSRAVWGWSWLESLGQDTRYALRLLRLNPAFTFAALLSLSLGIGANTGIFTIVNAVMLRALPVENPQQLVQLRGEDGEFDEFTYPIWEYIRDHQKTFANALAYAPNRFDLAVAGESHFVEGIWASGEFFRALGVPALIGRTLTREDDRVGGGASGPVAVISYAFWQSQYGGTPDVIGRKLRLNRQQFEIVGVTPSWFHGLDVDHPFEVAVPLGTEPLLNPVESLLPNRSAWWLRIIARLPPGLAANVAEQEINSLAPELARATLPSDWSGDQQKEYLRKTFVIRPIARGFSSAGVRYRSALLALMAVVGTVLLIACTNLASLLLARSIARRREIAVRLAIGASRWRIMRQLLTESLLLSLLGALGGLLFARWSSRFLVHLLSTSRHPLELDLALDHTVLLFNAGTALATGLLFGLVPSIRATQAQPNSMVQEETRGAVSGSGRARLRTLLVAGQVALSLLLLIGAGLFLRTMQNLFSTPLGFHPENVLLVRTTAANGVPAGQRAELFRSLHEQLEQLPGARYVSSSMFTPISGTGWNGMSYPEGYQAKSRRDTLVFLNQVSPTYFQTMGTPILLGRSFTDRDTLTGPKVVIINETTARRFFADRSPIGRTMGFDVPGKPGAREAYEIVGVVKDAKYLHIKEETRPTAFFVFAQASELPASIVFEVRSEAAADQLISAIRSSVAARTQRASMEFRSFETQVYESIVQDKVLALLTTFFGALALLLAMIGLYGVTAYTVVRRKAEIGVRMALGATRAAVLWLVLRDVLLMLAGGSILGVIAALSAGKLIASLLYGVKAADPMTMILAVLILGIATIASGLLPAIRASRLDPTVALRQE